MDFHSIKSLVLNTFGKSNVCGIMITGSYSTKEQETDSDIDIIIVTTHACRQTTFETKKFGIKLHYIIFPLNKIFSLLSLDILHGEYVYWSMFRKGTILHDNKDLLFYIKRMTTEFEPSIPEYVVKSQTNAIAEELLYLKKNQDSLTVALDVSVRTQQLIVGFLAPQCKYLDKAMRLFPTYRQMINNSLSNFINTGNADAYCKIINYIINNICTPSTEYSSSNTLLNSQNEEGVMVFFPNIKNHESCIIHFHRLLCKRFPKIIKFVYYIGNCNIQARGTYLAIIYNNNKEEILSYINEYVSHLKFHIVPNIYYPYNTVFFNLNQFGDKKFTTIVYRTFEKCTNLIAGLYEKGATSANLELAHIITLFLLKEIHKEKQSFVNSCFVIYVPDAINGCGQASHNSLLYRRKQLFAFLKDSVIENKDELLRSISIILKKNKREQSIIKEIISNIIRISNESIRVPYNIFYFSSRQHAIMFNLYDYILSILSLDNLQKTAIIFNCTKMINHVIF